MRPATRRIEQERFTRAVTRMKEIVVDPVRHDAYPFTVKTEARDCPLTNERARNDHPVCPAGSHVVRQRTKRADVTRDK